MLFINTVSADFTTWAVSGDSPLLNSSMEFWDFILTVISIFVLIAWILSIMFVLYGGLLLILSWWKDDKIKPAVNTIRYALLGLIITVASIFLFPILWNLIWIDVEQYAKPTKIFEKIEEIGGEIFGNTSNPTSNQNFWLTPEWDIPADFSKITEK